MIPNIFVELSIIVGVAFVVATIMKLFKQPTIISYIVSGILLGPHFLNLIQSAELINAFAEIGIAILLFMVGINIDPKVIKDVGKVALITGMGQIFFTSAIGLLLGYLMGFSFSVALYIAIAITFSSTIIIMKLLSDRGELETLHGRISVGFLLVQDIVAIFIMLIVSSLAENKPIQLLIFETLFEGSLLLIFLFIAGKYILPKITKFVARVQELLLLFSIAWAMIVSTLFYYFNFSIEIGALLAGVTLSFSPYRYEMSSKLKPLRDFFIFLFFVYLGSEIFIGNVVQYWIPIVVFSLFVLLGNPLIVIALMGYLGYGKRTGFLSGLTVAQISEFSLILIALGVKVGHLNNDILSLVTVIGLITIAGSTYFILYADKIFSKISKYLSFFERKGKQKKLGSHPDEYELILFGYNRIGYDILKSFKKMKEEFLVVDYNPDTINELMNEGINCKYGDAADVEFLDELNLSSVKMIVSTIPDVDVNMLIINKFKENDPIIIVVSHHIDDTTKLYKGGASFVIMPYFDGGHHTAKLIKEHKFRKKEYDKEKLAHLAYLYERKEVGHEHPQTRIEP